MKRILIFTFLFVTVRSSAQEIVPFTFGPLVSMTSTSLDSKPSFEDQVAGSGYNIGGFARLKLLMLYAQAEVSFGSKSTSVTVKTDVNNNIDFSNVTFKLKGADVSAIVGLKLFGLGSIGNFRLFGGYNWNNYSDITYSVDGNVFEASNVNNNNSSLLVGVGIDLSKFTFDVRYIHGLSDLTISNDYDVQSNVINLSFGFKII